MVLLLIKRKIYLILIDGESGRMITRATEPYSAFKLMSFLPNSAFAISVYLNYRLIRLEDGQLHFISENDFMT